MAPPASANALADGAAWRSDSLDAGTVALGHTECDVVRGIGAPDNVNFSNNRARRSRGGRQLFAWPAGRHLHLHRGTADVDRARRRAGGAAEEAPSRRRSRRRNFAARVNPELQPAASSLSSCSLQLASSQSSSARRSALSAPARALLSWAACFGSRVNRSGSASAVSILAMMPLMRSISASASAIRCFSGVRFSLLPRSGFSRFPCRAHCRGRANRCACRAIDSTIRRYSSRSPS